jgi:hypothetical protein
LTNKERQEIWNRLKNAKNVSGGIDLMLSIDLVSLLKENEHLHRQLDELRSEIVVMDAIKREGN